MKGAYVLFIELSKNGEIKIGALGKVKFKKGFYAYVGSAMNNLEKRVARHLRKEKKLHWHIDYLLMRADVKEIYFRENSKREECLIAKKFAKDFKSVKNFGCSDCKCESHLFYVENLKGFKQVRIRNQLNRRLYY